MSGQKVVVLAGTGPVGQRAAALLPKEARRGRADVADAERAEAACAAIEERFGVRRHAGGGGRRGGEAERALTGRPPCGLHRRGPGVTLVPEAHVARPRDAARAGDVNAVPPLGVEGTKATWDGKDVDGKTIFGALAIGDLKMKVHAARSSASSNRTTWSWTPRGSSPWPRSWPGSARPRLSE